MNATVRVDLHCHSLCSDGTLSPASLARKLVEAGVGVGSMVDHDTLEGLDEFAGAMSRLGAAAIPGLEITTFLRGQELHLLAYAFDPTLAEWRTALTAAQRPAEAGFYSIADSMRRLGPALESQGATTPLPTPAAPGRLDTLEAIALVHRAGGVAFLAHPLISEPDPQRLEALLSELKARGLDGLEAIYPAFTPEVQQSLCAWAQRLNLLVSGGSDYHGPDANHPGPGVDMPQEWWLRFRQRVMTRTRPTPVLPAAEDKGEPAVSSPTPARSRPPMAPRRRLFFFHIIFPSLLAIALFVATIYVFILPTFEQALLERKREMIRELTNSAWSLLAEAQSQEQTGVLSREQAQALAKERIASLRYGREGKDYFWLQDMHPRIVMHPYRSDLNDQDVSDFRDARGVRIFAEFADLVRRKQEGYIEYVWQWKDDPGRLEAKESYIRGFAPWNWIIGTGIYLEDVHQEITRIERNMVRASLGIAAVVALLLLYVMRESLGLERRRSQAEQGLHESRERYRSLVEATTEGTLLVVGGHCRYANPVLLAMLGYTESDLELMEVDEVVPAAPGNEAARSAMEQAERGEDPGAGFEGLLRRRDGTLVECVLAISRLTFAQRSGLILLARPVGGVGRHGGNGETSSARMGGALPLAMFQARATRRGVIVHANAAAQSLLSLLSPHRGDVFDAGQAGSVVPGSASRAVLEVADLFADTGVYEQFMARLEQENMAEAQLHVAAADAQIRTLKIRAGLVRDEQGQPAHMEAMLEDATAMARHEARRDALIARLQTSLLFLHEPVGKMAQPVVVCALNTPVSQVAQRLSRQGVSAAVVESETGTAVGIITDHDLRARILATQADAQTPAHKVMSAPLVSVSEQAQVYEAMLLMQEKGIQHLMVLDTAGKVQGMIRSRELLQFPSRGTAMLESQIARAGHPGQIVHAARRTPELALSLLNSGAHPRNIARMLAGICDAATQRFIELAIAEFGPSPAPFAFLALGSQGRQEQTLFTDQDNAIIYAWAPDDDRSVAEAYFEKLGRRVCGWLDEAGYRFCEGQVMAQNPRWRQPLAVWKEFFSDWVRRAEPKELLELSIFFDFRCVHGQADLASELRGHVDQVMRQSPAFLPHFARQALIFKPPMRILGRIVGSASGGPDAGADSANLLDLKDAMMPIVGFARLYALRHAVDATATLDRLEALAERGHISASTHEEIAAVYEFLMGLRLRHQARQIEQGLVPDNLINYRKLAHTDEAVLKQAFAQIDAVQKKISYDFLGGT